MAEIAERLAEQTATQGKRIEQIETRVVQQILAVERDAEATTLMALVRATRQIGGAVDRLEEISAAAGKSGAAELQGLRTQIDDLASAVAAAASPEASGERLQGALAEITAAATGRGEALNAIIEKLDNLPGALKSNILTELESYSQFGGRRPRCQRPVLQAPARPHRCWRLCAYLTPPERISHGLP